MFWEVLGSTLLGLIAALIAGTWLSRWFPHRPLMLTTGPAAGLLGGLIARVILGPGHLPAALLISVGVSAALLSLLIRPRDGVPSAPHAGPA